MKHTVTHRNMTDAEIDAAHEKNEQAAGGFPIGEADDTPSIALQREGYTDIRTFDTHGQHGLNAVGVKGDMVVAVVDADGPWAVDITSEAK